MTDTQHLTTEELSDRLRIPVGTLHNWASQGRGPAYLKIGRRRRYRLEDIQRWENGHYTQPQATACG